MPHDDVASGVTGRCYCGRISFSTQAPPEVVTYCHCIDCKRVTGSVAPAFAGFDEGKITYQPALSPKSANKGVDRWFCPDCGSQLGARFDYLPGQIYVPLGVIDQADELPPTLHCYAGAQYSWLHIKDDAQHVQDSGRQELSSGSV